MPAFALNRDTLEYTCGRLQEVEKACNKSSQGFAQQAKNISQELQKTLSITAKTSYASVSPEAIADIFSFTISLLVDEVASLVASEGLLILTYFVLREPVCIETFDLRILRLEIPISGDENQKPTNLSTCLAAIIWKLFNEPQSEFRKEAIVKPLIPLIEGLCVSNVGLFGQWYLNMCKILLGLTANQNYLSQVSLSFYRCTLSLNKHLSNSRVDTVTGKNKGMLSEEYIITVYDYIKLLLVVLEFLSDESPAKTMATTAATVTGGFFRFALGGGASSDTVSGTTSASGSSEMGFANLFPSTLELYPDSSVFHAGTHEEIRRVTIAALYLMFFSSNYFYLDSRIVELVTKDLLTVIPRRFIVTHMTQPIVITIAFALLETILRIYCFHAPARFVKAYFETFVFKILEEPDAPCGELKMAILAHIGRLFSGDTLPNSTVFKISELEKATIKYSYPMYGLLDVNDFEYIKLLFPRPFDYVFHLFITFDCDFESSNLIARLIAAVIGYTNNSSSQDAKFYTQKYTTTQVAPNDQQSSQYQIPTMVYSFQLSVHKFFHQLIAEYLQHYDPSFTQSATSTSILASDPAMKATMHPPVLHRDIPEAAASPKAEKNDIIIKQSSEFVPNLIMYSHYLGVNVYDLKKSFNYVSPAACLLSTCVEAATYALSGIAYSISYWAYLQQCEAVTKQKIPLNITPTGTEKVMARYADFFSFTTNVYDITTLMNDHNKKRLFDRGYSLFDRKLKKGVDYFVSKKYIVGLESMVPPATVTLEEPVTARRRTFDEEWYFNIYNMEVHRANYRNANEHYQSVAQFLLDNVTENVYVKIGITKELIGEIIGSGEYSNRCLLYEYVMKFSQRWSKLTPGVDGVPQCNADGKLPVEEALRDILGQFKLPGEGQVIDRIMQYIAYAYTQADTAIIKHHKVCHGLMFAIIMLNTDLHNSSIKTQRMTREMFCNNTKRIDTEEILSNELLISIYDNIAGNPFSLGNIETKKELVGLMDKYLKAPGGTKTLASGTVLKANAPTPGTKDTTLNMIGFGHSYYPYLITQCIIEWINSDEPLESPRKSTRSLALCIDQGANHIAGYSPTMIAKLPEKYRFAFFESLLLKLDSSVPIELLMKLTQTTPVNEQIFLLCLRPFFMYLSLLHNSLLRQTKPTCRTVVDELIRATGITSLSALSIKQDSIASTTSKDYSASYTDPKFDRTGSNVEASGLKNSSACYTVILLHTVLEFVYVLANLGKTKPALSNPLSVKPYSQASLPLEISLLTFANHFENKTSLLSTMYLGNLASADCWGQYLQIFACIEYFFDVADRNHFPRLEREEFLRALNVDVPKTDPLITSSIRKHLGSSGHAHIHRIEQDIQRIQRCISPGEDDSEDTDDAVIVYYICSLLDRRIIDEIYVRFMSFSSDNLIDLMRAFTSCFSQTLAHVSANENSDRERVTYYFRKGIGVLEGVAKSSLDRVKRVFREVQPMLFEGYSNQNESIVALCIGYYQPLIRMYFMKLKKRTTTAVQPAKVLDLSQPKRARSRLRQAKNVPKPSAPTSTGTSETTSVVSLDGDIQEDVFQHKLLEPLLRLICQTSYIQLIDLIMNFLEELQLSYAISGNLFMTIPALNDLAYAVEITATRIAGSQALSRTSTEYTGGHTSEVVTSLEQSVQLTDSIDAVSGVSTQLTSITQMTHFSTRLDESRIEPILPLHRRSDEDLDRLSLLIERCSSISNRLIALLDKQKAILPMCARMMYALSQQDIDTNIALSARTCFTNLIYMAYDCMVHSYSQDDAEKLSLIYFHIPSETELFISNIYVETFTYTIRILLDLAHSNEETSRRTGVNFLRTFVDKLMGNELIECKDLRLSPEHILKEIITGSIIPTLLTRLKAEPRFSPLSCSSSNTYVVVMHAPGSRMPILKCLQKIRKKETLPMPEGSHYLALCEESTCNYHTSLDIILDYILDKRMAKFMQEFVVYGLRSLIFETGSRTVLTFYKLISSYLCDMLSVLLEKENCKTDKNTEEITLVHELGYTEHGQVITTLTYLVNAVDSWLEYARMPAEQAEECLNSEYITPPTIATEANDNVDAMHSYICIYDYVSHLTNVCARFYENLSLRFANTPALHQLRELILRMITIITDIQKLELSGCGDENMLLVGLFTVGSRMSGDSAINQLVLQKIVEVLQLYAKILEEEGCIQGHGHQKIVTVVGAALTSLATMHRVQIESQKKTIFNLCLSLIVSDSREIRMKISVVMKALFQQ